MDRTHPMPSGLIIRTLALVILGLFVGVGFSLQSHDWQQHDEQASKGIFNVDQIADAAIKLTNQSDDTITWSSLAGTKRLIYFGYTYCPDICPTTLVDMAAVAHSLGKHKIRLNQLFVTVDPDRDTTEVLREYVPNFHEDLTGLRASKTELAKLAAAFKVFYAKAKDAENDPYYLVDHPSSVFFVDEHGDVRAIFNGDSTSNQMAEAILKLVK